MFTSDLSLCRFTKVTAVASTAILLFTNLALASISLTSFGLPYTQDFNTLASSGTSSTLPAEWLIAESGTNANSTYTAGTGSGTTGDTYSFGTTAADRALGGLQSGTLIPSFGISFTNNIGGAITSLLVGYTGEQWRLGAAGRVDRLDFQYSLDASSLTTGTWIDFDTLDFTAPVSLGTVGALDGNASPNRTVISPVAIPISIGTGSTFWIRWTDFNATGADDGLAIDDFSLTARGTVEEVIPEASALLVWSILCGSVLAGSKRRRDVA
jgi:uncharacterized protein